MSWSRREFHPLHPHTPSFPLIQNSEMGLMHITGHRDGPPAKVGVAITDLTTGLYTANSVMAALLARAKTGRGQHIDVALADCQIASLANIASSCLISGKPDTGRWGTAHPSIVPYKGFKTKDGDVMLGGGNDRLYGIMCEKLGRPEWIKDPRFVTNAERVKHRDELEELVEGVTTKKTTQEWLEILEGSGMPYAAINDVKATLEHEHSKSSIPAHIHSTEKLTLRSESAKHGDRSRASILRNDEVAESAGEVLGSEAEYSHSAADIGSAYRRSAGRDAWDEQQ